MINQKEVQVLIDEWVKLYNNSDKRTVEARGYKSNIIKLWHVLNCIPSNVTKE